MANSPQQARLKQERIIEAVRLGLEGPAAVEFLHQAGYATTPAGIAKHLRAMGGRGRIQSLIDEGRDNVAILAVCFPDALLDPAAFPSAEPDQAEMFSDMGFATAGGGEDDGFDSVKMTLRLPADLHEAVKLAARAERKKQNDLIVEILTAYLSRRPFHET